MDEVFTISGVRVAVNPQQVHILNETRGSTLEVVVSRMKLRGSSVRFILVSATVPNIEDIAAWIGSSASCDREAQVFQVTCPSIGLRIVLMFQ